MSSDYKTIDLTELRKREWQVIKDRRTKANVGTTSSTTGEPRDLVGLALSGGGVRSSMFNTGVLQGLERMGLLRHVDYLATVSGGGFIGGFITSQYQKRKGERYEQRFPLKEDDDGQNSSVNQLTRSGDYLKKQFELYLRVATGAVLHLLIIASLLILSCSALSWLWRLPDMTQLQRFLAQEAMELDDAPWWGAFVFAMVISWLYSAYRSPHMVHILTRLKRDGDIWQRRFKQKPCPWVVLGVLPLWRLKQKLGLWTLVGLSSLILIGYVGICLATYYGSLAMSDLVRAPIFFGVLAYLFGVLERRLATWAGLLGSSLLFVVYEGGFFSVYRDWFALSDLVRAFIPFGILAYLLGVLRQAREAGLKAPTRGVLAIPLLVLAIPSLPLIAYQRSAAAASFTVPIVSDFLVFVLSLGIFAWLVRFLSRDHSESLARMLRYKHPVLVIGLFLTILTVFANGDVDLGPRIGHVVRRLFPSLGQEVEASAGQVSLQMRNNQSIQQWLSTVTQYLVFIQLASGVIPLILPRQFASSAQVDAGGFSRSVYRGIVFLLFISLPLVICFTFLHENISGSVQIPSPIKRLAVSRDPTTGMYGYLIDHDQWTRARWFLAGLWGFMALNWFVDLNQTSLHRYYRRRLKEAYFDAFPDAIADPNDPDGLPETRLHEVTVDATGAPYPLLVATLNEYRLGSTSLDSGCAFIFSPLYCGWSRNQPIGALTPKDKKTKRTTPPEHRSCFIKTEAYCARDSKGQAVEGTGLHLVDAMAISGAAITPTNSHSLLDTILLLAANARLGQWLVNPEVGTVDAQNPNNEEGKSRREEVFQRLLHKRGHGIPTVSVWQLMRSLLKSPGGERERCFLSDGAHYDNLGMETLFERRCRLIIASDASHDPHYEFKDLSKSLRRLRAFWGIEFFLDRKSVEDLLEDEAKAKVGQLAPTDMLEPKDFVKAGGDGSKKSAARDFLRSGGDGSKKTAETPVCRSHHLVFAFRYPAKSGLDESQRWGLLVVLKPSLDGREDRESPGLFSFARSQSAFPMDDDMNQFYDENQCEYYRELGSHVAASILRCEVEQGSTLDKIMSQVHKPKSVDHESTSRRSVFAEPLEQQLLGDGRWRSFIRSPNHLIGNAPNRRSRSFPW